MNCHQIELIIRLITKLVSAEDQSILSDTLFVINIISQKGIEMINSLIEHNLISKVLDLHYKFPLEVLSICGNICSETNEYIFLLLDLGILDMLLVLLPEKEPKIQKKIYWVLSNIASAGVKAT